jgi:hypothetical protein
MAFRPTRQGAEKMLRNAASKVMWVGRTRALVFGLVMAGALFLALLSGVALARSFQCTDDNCYGTNNNDQIRERQGNSKQDDIYARGGRDRVNASVFGNDTDVTRGQRGSDRLNTADGDTQDFLICGSGNNDTAVLDVSRNRIDIPSFGCENFIVVFPDGSHETFANMSQAVSEEKAAALAEEALD